VNTAARLEAHGLPGEIQVSAHVRDLLKDKFHFVERGLVELKGKGQVQTHLMKSRIVEPCLSAFADVRDRAHRSAN
jgi:class 3 adenylate cyclase